MKNFISIAFLLFSICSFSQQLVYRSVNPNFGGGDAFSYQQLLNSANAQNSFTDPNEEEELSEIDQFTESLNRQLLGQLTRTLFNEQIGDDLTEGTYNFGSLAIEIFDSSEGLVINILDINTGEQTQIIIPN